MICDVLMFPYFRYSALKKDGQRLSVLLKKGHQVEAKPARSVIVYNLSLKDFNPPLFTLGSFMSLHISLLENLILIVVCLLDIECGGGFYVRSLVDDLGKGEITLIFNFRTSSA